MKPYSLHLALAGEQVLLANGDRATVAMYNMDAQPFCRLIGWTEHGEAVTWNIEGVASMNFPSSYDIVGMTTKLETRTAYINVYPTGQGDEMFDTKNRADWNAEASRIACVEVHYEVEV